MREVPGYRLELTPFGGIKDSRLGDKEGVIEAMKSFHLFAALAGMINTAIAPANNNSFGCQTLVIFAPYCIPPALRRLSTNAIIARRLTRKRSLLW
jgi:hypothetical protein